MERDADKGVTLIEMIVIIVVLGLAIPVLLRMWSDVSLRSVRSETLADAAFYAQQLMEEVKSKQFDENDGPPWTASATFGPDAGENSANKDTFNDVDDYVGCTDPRVTTPAPGYSRKVAVDYVALSSATWQPCGAVVCVDQTDCLACNQCCYKRVKVTVWRNDNLIKDVSLTSIVGVYK